MTTRYLCGGCGRVIEEEEMVVRLTRERRGECHGAPAYEEIETGYCPHCGSTVLDEVTIDDEMTERYGEALEQSDYWERKYNEQKERYNELKERMMMIHA